MLTSLSLFIGGRFSRAKRRNKLISFISLSSTIGIAVGVAVVIIGLSAMNGFERELQTRVLSVIPHGEFESVNQSINNWPDFVTQLQAQPQIVAAAPYVKITALAEKGSQLKAIEVRGIDPKLEPMISELPQFIDRNVWQQFQPQQQQIILGQGVADKLGVKEGDYLTLLIPNVTHVNNVQATANQTAQMPKRIRVKVLGLLSLHGQIDHSLALIPLADAQQYAQLDDGVSGVAVKITDVFNANQIIREVGNQINQYVYLKTWLQQYGFLHRDIQLVRTIMYLVMVLVIGVACFNIVSTLMMSVKDRAAEIAILRTMGATDALIKRIFIWQGLFSGISGSVIGLLFGSLIALNLTPLIQWLESLMGYSFLSGDIYFIDFLPSQLNYIDLILVSSTAILLSLFATWYPAAKASQLNPASVLSAK